MSKQAIEAIVAMGEAVIQNKELLTDLDAAIGDADHGINMARGFAAVIDKVGGLSPETDIGTVLKTVAMTLISTVGGASGPLYGTAFLRAATAGQGKQTIDGASAVAMLKAAIDGIQSRGKAVQGEKTMLDALEPALAAFEKSVTAGKSLIESLDQACLAAKAGAESTKTIVATKGRARYLGERSLGHEDPGAVSSCILLQAVTDYCRKQQGTV